ncbi:MAG: sulfotransferase domain-containing protein, partial [Acidimicrobiales bacterium]
GMGEDAASSAVYKNFVWNSERWDGFDFRDDDIVISTPPKCGTTWMQMQCALLLFRTADLPAPLAKLSPWLEMNTRPLDEVRADLEAQTHRRFIKTHTPLGGVPWEERVTYLHVSRDPRDVAQSWDNHMANLNMDRFFAARVAAVGTDDLADLGGGGPPSAPPEDPEARFWHWVEGDGVTAGLSGLGGLVQHSRSFWDVRQAPNVHLFHYGDLRADLAGQMVRVAEALGVEPPTDELVDAARFENMKARSDELVPNSDTPFWESNQQFFHKARSGEWRALIGDEGLPRYEAALRSATDDEELIAWLHGGWLAQA